MPDSGSNEYIANIKHRRENPKTILDTIEEGQIAHDVFRRILSHWNLPDGREEEIHTAFLSLDFLNEDLNQKLKEKDVKAPNQYGLEEFECEFRSACKLSMIIADCLPPPKAPLRQEYKKTIKKITPLLERLQAEFKSITPHNKLYIYDIFRRGTEATPRNLIKPHLLEECEYTVDRLVSVIQNPDFDDVVEDYLRNFAGGNVTVKNRKATVSALIESYHLCFDIMPTTSESCPFRSYAEIFYEWIGFSGPEEDMREDTLNADIKNLLKNYKEKSKS